MSYCRVEHCNSDYRRVANNVTDNISVCFQIHLVGHSYHFKIGEDRKFRTCGVERVFSMKHFSQACACVPVTYACIS